jgi:GNAT superfamily N-acetyltransferase
MLANISQTERHLLNPLFSGHRPSFLMDAVLEGHLGRALADERENPHAALLSYADVVIFGGDASHPSARELVGELPVDKAVMPSPGGWQELLSDVYGDRLIAVKRFAFSDRSLDPEHLGSLRKDLPYPYDLRRIDLELARVIAADSSLISEDHVRNFKSPQDFVKRGIGYCILHGDRVVSGASSYAICSHGIEVQVNTHPDYRQKGLATVVSATLVEHCLENGMAAHWDAGNQTSVRLAERLGYILDSEYQVLVRVK